MKVNNRHEPLARRSFLTIGILGVAGLLTVAFDLLAAEPTPDKDGWYELFDGKGLDDWKTAEDLRAFKVEDGLIVAGPSKLTHLYYTGPVQKANFKNFELKAEVKTRPKGNSGIFFHTDYQAKGIPAKGFEFQINNTGSDKRYRTGAIYPTKPLDKVLVKDDEWFECHLSVRGNKVVLKVNGEITQDVELPVDAKSGLSLSSGTIAIQSHDPESVVYFRKLRLKPLE
jgi:hypothetical protein